MGLSPILYVYTCLFTTLLTFCLFVYTSIVIYTNRYLIETVFGFCMSHSGLYFLCIYLYFTVDFVTLEFE